MLRTLKKSVFVSYAGRGLIVAIFSLLLLSGCDSHDKATIQWQLPLTAPEDPHGGQDDQALLPEWATAVEGNASLMFLQTTTARSFNVDAIKDEKMMFHDWDITLLGWPMDCAHNLVLLLTMKMCIIPPRSWSCLTKAI